MGGLFKAPKQEPARTAADVAPIATPTATPAVAQSEESARQQRVESLKRQARGRAATITTSPRGLLALSAAEPSRKSLLGE